MRSSHPLPTANWNDLVELHAAYMPDVARAVSGIPRADPEEGSPPGFDIA
jgi:hypothetical protein